MPRAPVVDRGRRLYGGGGGGGAVGWRGGRGGGGGCPPSPARGYGGVLYASPSGPGAEPQKLSHPAKKPR